MSRLVDVRGSTAAEISHSIEQSVLAGYYPSGTRLPTVRELAQHLGVNKNTVSRAYQILARRGYVEAVRGRGVSVRLPDNATHPALTSASDWQSLLRHAFAAARSQDIPHEYVVAAALRAAGDVYSRNDVRLAFVECNQPDTEDLAVKLQDSVGYSVDRLILSQCQADPEATIGGVDLITTSFFHLAEVRRLAGDRKQDVIGLHVIPMLETILDVARLDAMVIAVVCDTASAEANLEHIVKTYHPDVTLIAVLSSETERLRQLHAKVDAVVVTRSAADLLATYALTCPVIVVNWTIEQQSVDFLRQRLDARLWEVQKSYLTSGDGAADASRLPVVQSAGGS